MIYKFRSKAAGDVIMLAATAERVLAAIGKAPAASGILEPATMPAALAALEKAVADDDAARSRPHRGDRDDDASAASGGDAVSLRRRAWPLVEMIRRAQAAGEPIVWGA